LNNGRIVRLGSVRVKGSQPFEQELPIPGLKEKPKRAMICYLDDVLGEVDNK